MIRTLDATRFNAISAHPDVRPWLGFDGELDLTALVRNPANICILTDNLDGGYILVKLHPGLYAAHTLSLPSARGRPMLQLMRDGFAMMFTATDAVEITTMVPDGATAAARWAEVAGFRETFRREAFFPLSGQLVGASFRSLRYEDWVLSDGRNAILGEEFHAKLEAAQDHIHPEDKVHDLWVGATILGCKAGNLTKSIGMYNRWASQSGYQQAVILSACPSVVDIGDAVVQLSSGQIEVLQVATREAPYTGALQCR